MNRLLLTLLGTAAVVALPAHAQTDITDNRESTIRTSDTGDVTIASTATVAPASGPAVVVDSSNDATINGTLSIEDRDDAVALDIQTGNAGDVVLNGAINVVEDFTAEDIDDDRIPDGRVAQGSGRTGILISGADTFTGNLSTSSASSIRVEGNESAAIRVADGATLDGNLSVLGQTLIVGDRSVGLGIDGDVSGDVTLGGNLNSTGEGTSAVRIAGDVGGTYSSQGTIANTGYRFATRQSSRIRDLFDDEDRLQAGAAVQVSGSVAGGLFFRQVVETSENADGETVENVVARSSITQAGNAPAILVDGNGTPLAFGIVAQITDPNDAAFDAALQYAFINQGDMVANGVFDDINATVFEARGATFEGGISNAGIMQAATFRSGDDGTDDQNGQRALARVIVLGDNTIAETIQNSGLMFASISEASDTIFADRANVLAARDLEAVAIDIAATAETAALVNGGTISAILTGRSGQAVVVRDASGTLRTIDNTGALSAIAANSDSVGLEETDFNLIALDLRANTVGVRINQLRFEDATNIVAISGDILLGSGDDVITSTAGSILGAIDFGAGASTLDLTNTNYAGQLSNTDGTLVLSVRNGTLELQGSQPVQVAEASITGNATFRPTIDGQSGTASTLVASGNIEIGENVGITPVIESIVGGDGPTRFALASGNSLTFGGDVSALGSGFNPFLYDTVYTLDEDTNTLFVDLRLRSTEELGLDSVQANAFESTFEALAANPELAAAVINITNGEVFNAAYNQLLPEFAAASRQFVMANTDGAVGAVGSHLDAARRGQAKPGGFWFEEFFYYADRAREQFSEQYRGQGFGFTGGVDTAVGPFHAVGVNVGFASTEIQDTVGLDDPLDVTTVQFGGYAGLEMGGFGLDAYAGYGINDFESNRIVSIGDYNATASGEWSGSHINGSLRAGYTVPMGGRYYARPSVSLDYLSLTENDYIEEGPTGIAFAIDERTVDTGAVTAMLNLGAEFMGKRTWVRPALRVGYRNEFVGDVLTTGLYSGLSTPFSIEAADFPDQGLLVGLSIAAGSDYSSFGFDLDSDIRDGFIRTTGRVVVRILF